MPSDDLFCVVELVIIVYPSSRTYVTAGSLMSSELRYDPPISASPHIHTSHGLRHCPTASALLRHPRVQTDLDPCRFRCYLARFAKTIPGIAPPEKKQATCFGPLRY